MALYEYECQATGEKRDIQRSMKDPPPMQFEEDGKAWTRVFSFNYSIGNDGSVHHAGQRCPSPRLAPDYREGKIVTRFGHKVREHGDGTYSTLSGDRLVHDKKSRETQKKLTGFFEEGESPK